MANEMVVLKDGETNAAIDSFTIGNFRKYIELVENKEILWPQIYSYGIKLIDEDEQSDRAVYALYETGSAPTGVLITKVGDEVYFTNGTEERS